MFLSVAQTEENTVYTISQMIFSQVYQRPNVSRNALRNIVLIYEQTYEMVRIQRD